MRKILGITVIGLGLCVFLAILSPLLNSLAQKGYFGGLVRALTQMFIPKTDLYQPLFREPIDVATSGSVFHYRFVNRYAGRHTLGLLAHEHIPSAPDSSYTRLLALSVECRDDRGIRYRHESTASLSAWWRPSTRDNGFEAFAYQVPEDLPLGNPVDCEVVVKAGDPTFAATYRIYAFYAQKQSEE